MKTYFVDSFTNQKFKGNPAAVCMIEKDLDATTMQNIATEIGFSETAFVKKISGDTYSIKFFTPKKEIPLCGHATLASSKIIFDTICFRLFLIKIKNLCQIIFSKNFMIADKSSVRKLRASYLPLIGENTK